MGRRSLLCLSLAHLLLAGCGPERSIAPGITLNGPAPTNVLFLSVDTLRHDVIGRYSGGEESPFLDSLLASGVALDDLTACSTWTGSTFPCLFNGASGSDLGLHGQLGDIGGSIPDDFRWGIRRFTARGYASGLVNANHIFNTGLGGFEASFHDVVSGTMEASSVTDAALVMAEDLDQAGAPWLLAVHYFDPHTPLTPPQSYLGGLEDLAPSPADVTAGWLDYSGEWEGWSQDLRDAFLAEVWLRYRAEVRYFDDQVQRLWEELDALGILDDTLVVLWADHGEQFGEHRGWNHAQTVHVEERAVLGGLWARTLVPGAWTGPTTQTDLLPTALAILGIDPYDEADSSEPEITGFVLGEAPADRIRLTTLAKENANDLPSAAISAERGSRVLIYDGVGNVELYDRAADPREATDLFDAATSGADPEVQALWQAIRAEGQTLIDAGLARPGQVPPGL